MLASPIPGTAKSTRKLPHPQAADERDRWEACAWPC